MRVSSTAICTLAALTAGNQLQSASAVTNHPAPTPTPKTSKLVVSAIVHATTPVKNIAAPETLISQQFSANKGVVVKTIPNPNNPSTPTNTPTVKDLVITATDVQILGATPELQEVIGKVTKTRAGGETSRSQIQQDLNAILNTGLFADARVNTSNTPNGIKVIYQVQPVIVRSLQLSGGKALTLQIALDRLQPLLGKPISPTTLSQSVQQINKWYTDHNYVLARVISITPSPNGILTVNVAEGVVSNIKFRFVNDKGNAVDDKGKPVKGRSQESFLRQQLKSQPGQVFQQDVVQQDIRQLYQLGLFQNITVALEGDAKQVDVVYELTEAPARSFNLGGNYSNDSGIGATINYKDQNLGGINQTLGANAQITRRDIQFDGNFTNPYRATNPDSLGYRVDAFRRAGLSETFDDKIKLANGDKVRQNQIGGGITLQRPLGEWDTSLGLNYARTSIRDRDGKLAAFDAGKNPLSFSGKGIDDLTTVSFNAVRDQRNNPLNPTQGSLISLSAEQSIPLGEGNIEMKRLRANYSQYVPIRLLGTKDQEVLAVNLQGGTVIGDLAPYQTFNLGGPNSVRGYDFGAVGSGRSYVLASAEYRFPILQPVGGVLFADFASDLGTGNTVLGEPGVVRGKPGTGFGYGAGVRVQSPLGLLRADYGINDQGESRFQFGVGQRF